MRCYFLKTGRLEGVEVMPAGLSDEEAVARANVLLAKRQGPFDSFEDWEGSRLVFRQSLSAETPETDHPQAELPDSTDEAH
jgi:hypothetical protein